MNRSYEPDADRQLSEPGTTISPQMQYRASCQLLVAAIRGHLKTAPWWARVAMRQARELGLWKDDIEKQRAA